MLKCHLRTKHTRSWTQWVVLEDGLVHVVSKDERVGISIILRIVSTCEMAYGTITRLVLRRFEALDKTDAFAKLIPLLISVNRFFCGMNGLIKPLTTVRQGDAGAWEVCLRSDVNLT